jgi:drug/metabolite transporter (DMT)-like permease
VIYYRLLAAAYHHGDMSQAYPLMRGAAPLLVALASVPLLGERLHWRQDVAIMLICGGVLTLTILRGATPAPTPRPTAAHAAAPPSTPCSTPPSSPPTP